MAIEAKVAAKMLRKMAKTEHRIDAKALRSLADLVESGKGREAYKFYHRMDTYVREGVPEEVMQKIYLDRCPGKRKVVQVSVRLKGCKTVFKVGFQPGEVKVYDFDLPGDATKDEIERWLVGMADKVLKDTVTVMAGNVKTVKV